MTPRTAATAVQPPAQPPLAGLPPAATDSAAAAATARVAVSGVLQRDALHYTTPAGQACVQALLAQHVPHHPRAAHILATRLWAADDPHGSTDAAHLAGQLFAGTACIALGTGLEPDVWHGQPVLRLIHTTGIARAPAASPTPAGDH